MFTAGPTTSEVPRRLLVTAVLSLMLGILGMHALNTHAAAMGESGRAAMSMPTTEPAGASVDTTAAGAAMTVDAAVTVDVGPVAPEHGMGEMAMLCVFMIVAAAGLTLLAALGLRRLPTPLWVLPRRRASQRVPKHFAALRTGTGPPPVWAFSVIRC